MSRAGSLEYIIICQRREQEALSERQVRVDFRRWAVGAQREARGVLDGRGAVPRELSRLKQSIEAPFAIAQLTKLE
jgi:hypothetical protein